MVGGGADRALPLVLRQWFMSPAAAFGHHLLVLAATLRTHPVLGLALPLLLGALAILMIIIIIIIIVVVLVVVDWMLSLLFLFVFLL